MVGARMAPARRRNRRSRPDLGADLVLDAASSRPASVAAAAAAAATTATAAPSEATRMAAVYALRRAPERYRWDAPGQLFLAQGIEREVLAALRQAGALPLDARSALEVGCGPGHWLRELVRWGVPPERITGVDLLPDRLAAARRRCPPGVRLECADAARLPFDDASFDLVLQFTLFTSVLDEEQRRRIAREMVRVLRPDGLILWYDFRVAHPRNPDVRRVGRRELRALFPDCDLELRSTTLAPPIARRLADRAALLCLLLARIPLLRTHYLAVLRPRRAAAPAHDA